MVMCESFRIFGCLRHQTHIVFFYHGEKSKSCSLLCNEVVACVVVGSIIFSPSMSLHFMTVPISETSCIQILQKNPNHHLLDLMRWRSG